MKNEEKYEHLIFEGCSGGNSRTAAVVFFKKRNPDINIGNFESKKEGLCLVVCHKGLEGVSIVEEQLEIYVGEVNILKSPELPPVQENFTKGKSILARSIGVKVGLLDLFSKDVE